MMRSVIYIVLHILIFLVGILSILESDFDVIVSVLTITLITAEIHYARTHNGPNFQHRIVYSPWAILIGLALSITCVLLAQLAEEGRQNRAQKSYAANIETDDAAVRRYGLFDEQGRLPFDMMDQFSIRNVDEQRLLTSSASRLIRAMDSEVFGNVTSLAAEWSYTFRYAPESRDWIASIYEGLQQRVQFYVSSVPALMRQVEDEHKRLHTDTEYAIFIDRQHDVLEPVYDSMLVALEKESALLESDLKTIRHILSEPKYWDMSNPSRPKLMRSDIAQMRNGAAERVVRATRTINACRDAILGYYIVLEHEGLVTP